MATVEPKQSGFYLGKWYTEGGKRMSKIIYATDKVRALAEANRLEAICRFWEAANAGIFTFMAQIGFSPNYTHYNFTHKAYIPVVEFRKLLREAEIEFLKPSQWRDSANPRHKKKPPEE
jgi:hypothetical protein